MLCTSLLLFHIYSYLFVFSKSATFNIIIHDLRIFSNKDVLFFFRIDKCKYMNSAKKPLWLVFENEDELGEDIIIIFKNGDGELMLT